MCKSRPKVGDGFEHSYLHSCSVACRYSSAVVRLTFIGFSLLLRESGWSKFSLRGQQFFTVDLPLSHSV